MRLICAFLLALLLLSIPVAPVRAQSSCFGATYVVQAGETLYSIAVRCRIPFPGLVGINVELSDPNLIRPGQVIRLQAGAPLYTAPAGGPAVKGGLQEGGQVYIVRPGDSLARIAYLYHTTLAELRRFNPEITDNLVIRTGQRIQMPPDARKTPGWVGVSTRIAGPGDEFEVRVVDFPPYSDIHINVGRPFEQEEGDMDIFYSLTIESQTDARGQVRINVEMPFSAWVGQEWIIEVVTTEHDPIIRALSPTILIDYY